jgi:bifunctional pyridoxal-dependent enzyme with beta-cystathionase and maltose regulon repressor activities
MKYLKYYCRRNQNCKKYDKEKLSLKYGPTDKEIYSFEILDHDFQLPSFAKEELHKVIDESYTSYIYTSNRFYESVSF